MDIITKLRVPKIQIIDNLELSIFDITASYLGVYFVSKYIFNISRPEFKVPKLCSLQMLGKESAKDCIILVYSC